MKTARCLGSEEFGGSSDRALADLQSANGKRTPNHVFGEATPARSPTKVRNRRHSQHKSMLLRAFPATGPAFLDIFPGEQPPIRAQTSDSPRNLSRARE
jgi:hypothetical protein